MNGSIVCFSFNVLVIAVSELSLQMHVLLFSGVCMLYQLPWERTWVCVSSGASHG